MCDTKNIIRKISIVWNKGSNEDLQRYSELVNRRLQDISLPDDIVHCTEPFCLNHQHYWIFIVKQFVTVLFSLQMYVFLATRIVSV